jgi:SAM-dependent methyltransferase
VVSAEAGALHRVLRGLVVDGVLSEQDDGRFGLTPAGELLRSDVPGSVHGAIVARGDVYYAAAGGLLHAVQHGGNAFEHVYGTSLFEYLSQHPEKVADFQRSMVARAHQEAADVLSVYDFRRFRRVVDVGGGYGILLAAILQSAPGLDGVLVDLPRVEAQARERLGEAGLLPRCQIVAGDFFRSVTEGGDVYILSRVIHDWDDAAAARILANCHAAMPEGGTLLLVEAVLPERACEQPGAIGMDLHMLTLLHGRERMEAEYRSLLTENGFELNRVIPTPSPTGLCILEATRVAVPPSRQDA